MRREYTFLCFISFCIPSSAKGLQPDGYALPFHAGLAVCVLLVLLLAFLHTRLNKAKKAYSQLQEAHADLQETCRKQSDSLKKCRDELEECQSKLNAGNERVGQLLEEEENLRAELMQLRQQLDTLQADKRKHPNQKPLTLTDDTDKPAPGPNKKLAPLPGEERLWNSNDEFLAQTIRVMRSNMDNSNLNIEIFARQMNISRSMLCRRIKAITGLTPVEFMHRMRITYAIELLRSDYTFSQIAYMTGFNDPKYFTKCFKRHTGLTPSEYKEKRLQKSNKGNKEILSHNNSYQFGNYLGEDLYS